MTSSVTATWCCSSHGNSELAKPPQPQLLPGLFTHSCVDWMLVLLLAGVTGASSGSATLLLSDAVAWQRFSLPLRSNVH
jgi:hypothetical protein